jgi:hypothetical protein
MVKRRRKRSKKVLKSHHNRNLLCGDCSSLAVCRKKYNIDEFAQACTNFDSNYHGDKFLRQLKKKLNSKRFILDPSILEELKTFRVFSRTSRHHRELRRVPVSSYGRKELFKLSSLLEETQAFRDRVLDVRVYMQQLLIDLGSIENIAKAYMYDKYSDRMRALRNDATRTIFMRSVLRPLYEIKDEIQFTLETSELTETNLSNTHFALKEIRSIAELVLGKVLNT